MVPEKQNALLNFRTFEPSDEDLAQNLRAHYGDRPQALLAKAIERLEQHGELNRTIAQDGAASPEDMAEQIRELQSDLSETQARLDKARVAVEPFADAPSEQTYEQYSDGQLAAALSKNYQLSGNMIYREAAARMLEKSRLENAKKNSKGVATPIAVNRLIDKLSEMTLANDKLRKKVKNLRTSGRKKKVKMKQLENKLFDADL